MNDLIGKVHCGDAIEILRTLPDGCADLVLTDPPYGIGEAAGKNKTRGNKNIKATDFGNKDWDRERLDREYFLEIFRVSKNQIIFGGNYYIDYLKPGSCWIVWDKDNTGDFADCELAWASFKTAVRKFTWRWNGMLQQNMKNKEERVHPTQKPVPLAVWILKRYAKRNDLVLDPFCGSGSFLIAAAKLGMRYIGIDRDNEYCDIAKARIANELSQLSFG